MKTIYQCQKQKKKTTQKDNSNIDVADILDVLNQNNFSNQKQAELLQIIDYALTVKHYPDNIHEIIFKKIQILLQSDEIVEKNDTNTNQAYMKICAVAILELLNTTGFGKVNNDLTKICNLITRLTGFSYDKIYNELQKGIQFTNYHSKQIDEVNKIFSDLNMSISICSDKCY